jgi:hypothetical protein
MPPSGFFYYIGTSWRMDTNYWRTPGFQQTGEHPVAGVNWRDAATFCEWLTMVERGKGVISDHEAYRLPTEAEWDTAALGTPNPAGTMNAANVHPVLNLDQFPFTSPVGSFPANPNGFYDMAGNVWEFCLDQISERQPYRVIRGGCCRIGMTGTSAFKPAVSAALMCASPYTDFESCWPTTTLLPTRCATPRGLKNRRIDCPRSTILSARIDVPAIRDLSSGSPGRRTLPILRLVCSPKVCILSRE